MLKEAPPFSRPVRVRDLPAAGTTVTLSASAEERAAIAAELGLLGLDALSADLAVRPIRHGARVTGTMKAEAVQACVVTLEPVPEAVAEEIDVAFVKPDERPRPAEIDVDPVAADPPDPFDGESIDLGALVVEHLVLGLDPYPRRPGAVFEAGDDAAGGGDDRPSPFATLAKLKPQR